MTSARRPRLVLGVAVVLLVAGCAGVHNLNIPVPPRGSPGGQAQFGTTTTVSDLTGAALPTLASTPPPTVPLTGGTSTLSGVVTGPNGVVAGATVLVERLVGATEASKTVAANANGGWALTTLLGGLYRIRAWMSPDLDLITPQIMFLDAGATQSVNLTLMSYGGQTANATVTPSPPQVSVLSTLVVNVLQEVVGGDGIVRASGMGGAQVFLLAAGNVVLGGVNPVTTNASGSVTLTLECSSMGPVGLSVTVNGGTAIPLAVPDCSPAVVLPTTVPSSTTVAGAIP
ncbi:MAG: carboxypeptidase-like regulatory domain-containing protein [Acidimicrobiales bacterium]